MKQNYVTKAMLLAAAFALLSCTVLTAQHISKTSNQPSYQEKTIVFRVKPQYRSECAIGAIDDANLQQVFSKLGTVSCLKLYPRNRQPETEFNRFGDRLVDLSLLYELHYSAEIPVPAVASWLTQTGKLMYAEPHYIYYTTFTPNDPSIGNQYYLGKINAYNGWNVEQGDTNVVIGIVDSGTDPDHPDLAANLKHNYNDPVNGIDDDGDGYIDNFSGWDISENDNNATVDMQVHGSHVSGCADAVTDNGVGVAGPGFHCKFLPVKVAKATSINQIDNGYEGIAYAADHGCNVINCSWGGAGGGQYGQDVINYAVYNQNVTVVVSAGNNNDEVPQYPAAYNNVFAIASTNSTDIRSGFSTYGYFVSMCAPGNNIYSTVYNNTYTYMSGTSMASPIAAGCAAIVKSHFPSYSGLQVGEQLRVTCDNIYPVNLALYADKLGKGRVNMYNALTVSSPSIRFIHMQLHDGNDDAFVIGDTIRISGVFKNFLAPTSNLTATLSTTSGAVTILNSTISLGVINTLDSMDNNSNPFTVKINAGAPINVSILFKITYSDGSYSDFQIFYIPVNVDYINVAINKVGTTITSKGRIGWNADSQSGGLGFTYNAVNILYDGGLMIGTNSATVSDVIRGTGTNNDADFISTQNVHEIGPIKSDMDLTGKFNDNPSSAPMNILVTHKSFAWVNAPDDKYVIVEYAIKNNGSSTLSNMYAGICNDWDIMDYSQNKADVDLGLKMGYAYSTQVAGVYGGIKLLTTGGFNHYAIDNIASPPSGIDISTGFTTAQKYTTLSTSRPQAGGTGTGNDILDVVSSGPFTVAPGDSVVVAFALIAGDDLADLSQSAGNAQIKYDIVTGVKEVVSANQFFLSVTPNPAANMAHINFNLKKADNLAINIYNVLGNKMMSIAAADYKAGEHSIALKINSLATGMYFVKMENDSSSSVAKFSVVK